MPPTINIKTAANLLQKSGFENPISNFEKIEIEYSNPITLLHDLKGMGQSNILHKRAKKFISKKFIEKICQKLQELYGNENKSAIKVNFEVITITGWKFDPNVKKLEIKET
jgi:hypothetical protein